MAEITYLKGDATTPQAEGPKMIAHISNDIGGWGRGFVLALSKKWKAPEKAFRKWYKDGEGFGLGEIQIVPVTDTISVVNMIGQKGIYTGSGMKPAGADAPPIRYDAVEACLEKLAAAALEAGASVHMPRIGCGLAGGKWEQIEPLIMKTLIEHGVDVYIYDYD